MQQLPVTDLTQNLAFTRNGTIWASWRLDPASYGYRSAKEKAQIKRSHEELFQAFRGEVMISAITANLDPAAVAEQMLSGISDEDLTPDWAEEVAATLDLMEEIPPGTRTFWLTVPLKASGVQDWTRRQWQTIKVRLSEQLALPRAAPEDTLVQSAVSMVERIQRAIPGRFNARPATPAEHVWLAIHHQTRGLNTDSLVPDTSGTAEVGISEAFGHRAYPQPYIEQAGLDEQDPKTPAIYRRRWAKVVSPEGTPSYQVIQPVTSFPAGGFVFPGGEWMQQADEMPFPVDWVWRMRVDSAARARVKNAAAERRYRNQLRERTDEGRLTGSNGELDDTASNIADLQRELGRSAAEVKVSTAVMLAVAAPTAREAELRANILREAYNEMEVRLEPFMGKQQEELWWQMQIGVATSTTTRKLMHETTGWNLAGAVPITNTALGGRAGMFLGWNITTGVRTPVLFDLEAQVMGNHSACFGVAGELGAGKTHTLKRVGGDTVDRGGRLVVTDRSSTREWGEYGAAIADCVTLDFANPTYSIDPLRILGPTEGAAYVESLASMLLNIQLTDDVGMALAEALQPEYVAEHEIGDMTGLMRHLLAQKKDPAAVQLGKKLQAFQSRKLGAVLFDQTLPPLPMTSQALVFCTYDLSLPNQLEVTEEHLFRQLGTEKIFGRALYALMARLAQRICFSDRGDLAGFIVPEAHHLTSNQQGNEIISTFIKEGRKAKAYVGLDSHDPDEFGPTASLIPTRLLMRHVDKEMARKGLKWLFGPTFDDDALAEEVTRFSPADPGSDTGKTTAGREGEGLLLDPFGQVGKIQVTPPARAHRRVAISSTPDVSSVLQKA